MRRWLLSRRSINLCFCSVAVLCISCTEDGSLDKALEQMDIIDGDYVEWNLAPNGVARLCCGLLDTVAVKDLKICWYEIKDSAVAKIDGAINNYYDVVFVDIGTRNLLCRVSYTNIKDDSIEMMEYPFHVAYTGLPVLYIDTENGQTVENKTDKIPAVLELMGGANLMI